MGHKRTLELPPFKHTQTSVMFYSQIVNKMISESSNNCLIYYITRSFLVWSKEGLKGTAMDKYRRSCHKTIRPELPGEVSIKIFLIRP